MVLRSAHTGNGVNRKAGTRRDGSMFEVIVRLADPRYNNGFTRVYVQVLRSGHEPIAYNQEFYQDLFKSQFNHVMEEIANSIQEHVGNNPDEKV